jgi:hypothetical protein
MQARRQAEPADEGLDRRPASSPPRMRAMSLCRAAWTGAFQRMTAWSMGQEVMPCGTLRAGRSRRAKCRR